MSQCYFGKVTRADNTYRCRCGRVVVTPHPPDRIDANCRITRLGDRVEYWLTRFGITGARWSRWMAYLQLTTPPPSEVCCDGCDRRRERLNRISDDLAAWRAGLSRRVAAILCRV